MSDLPEGFQPEEEQAPEGFIPEGDLAGQISLSPYEELRMRGLGTNLGATTGPPHPEEVLTIPESLAEPPIRIPRIQAKSALGKVLAAPLNVGLGIGEAIGSPLGLAALPVGGTELGAPIVKGIFGGLAAKAAGEAAGRASVSRDPGEISEAALQAALAPGITIPGTFKPAPAPEVPIPPRGVTQTPTGTTRFAYTEPAARPAPKPAQVSAVKTVEPPAPPVETAPTVQPPPAETGAPAPPSRIIGSAVRLKDGTIIKSKPGESHTQAMKEAGVTRDQFSNDARDIGFYTADQDFVGQYDLPKQTIEAYDESKGAPPAPPPPEAPAEMERALNKHLLALEQGDPSPYPDIEADIAKWQGNQAAFQASIRAGKPDMELWRVNEKELKNKYKAEQAGPPAAAPAPAGGSSTSDEISRIESLMLKRAKPGELGAIQGEAERRGLDDPAYLKLLQDWEKNFAGLVKPTAPAFTGVDAQTVAGKPLGEWFTVKDAKELPKGEARALLARTIGVANQPSKILSALKSSQERIRKRVGEIYAPPATEVAPVTPAAAVPAPEAAAPAPEAPVTTPPEGGWPKPNQHGVYSEKEAENLRFTPKKGDRNAANIKVMQIGPDQWIVASGFDTGAGSMHGRSRGLNSQQVFRTRNEAIASEAGTLIGDLINSREENENPKQQKNTDALIDWARKLVKKQAPELINSVESAVFDNRIEHALYRQREAERNLEEHSKGPRKGSEYLYNKELGDFWAKRVQFQKDRVAQLQREKAQFLGTQAPSAAPAPEAPAAAPPPPAPAPAPTPAPAASSPPPAPTAPAVKLSESDMRDLVSDLTQLSRRSDLDVEERANVARAIEAARMGNPAEGLALRDRLKELAVPKTKLVKGIKFGGTGERIPDLIDWLKDAFPSGVKITSKSDYGRLVDEATGAAREVLFKNKGASVDTVMKAAELEGMHFGSQDEFINEVLKAGSGRTETGGRLSAEERMLEQEAAQVEEFQATALRNRGRTPAEKKAATPVPVESLKVGDKFTIKGEQFTVSEITPEGDVITDDGKRFGRQALRDGQTIHPDKGEVIETSEQGPGPIGMGGAASGEIKPTGPRGEEIPTYGVAARVLEKQRQAGTIEPIEPGEGVSPEEQIQRGRDLLAAGANPEAIMRDMERTKRFNADDAAVLRAHGEILYQQFFAASDQFGPHTPVAEKAFEDYSAWQKRYSKLRNEWHQIGETFQGETEVDTGTFHGLRKAWIDATGKDFTPKQAAQAEGIAKGVKAATEEVEKGKADTLAEVGKTAATETGKRPASPKPGEVAVPDAPTIWKRAKELLDAGEDDFDTLRHKLAQEFGIPVEEVYRKLTEPKSVRTISDDMYRKMANRRRLVNDAKDWLRNEQSPGWLQFMRRVPRVFFTAKILGHGTVGMITHAGLNIFNPGAWRTYWPNFFRQYRLIASKAYHERMMQDLLRDPLFTKARRAGLANDPFRMSDDYQTPTFIRWLDRIGLTGNRGFDALKLFRQARFNQIWNSLPESLQTPGYAKLVADGVNHATGAIRRPFREWANWTFFAPRLEASRWAWMVKDPWEAAKTLVDWEKATPEARAFAMSQLKEKAAIAGTYYGLLMMNQGLLEASGSDQRINFTNPRRGDFLAFKAAGHNIGIVGPMLGMVRLFANLYHAAGGKRGKVESLTPRAGEAFEIGGEYARGKLSPFAGFGVDVVSQADFQGRPMPYSTDKTPKYLRRQGLGPYTYGEYAAQEFTPIPVSEAVREVWRDQGMGEDDINTYLKALAVGVAAGSTGARVSAESPPSPKQ